MAQEYAMTLTPEVHREAAHYVFKAAMHFVCSTGSKDSVEGRHCGPRVSTRRISPDKWYVTPGFLSCIESVILLTGDVREHSMRWMFRLH